MGIYEDQAEALHVARMMVKYGGMFVHILGHALEHADNNNTERIKEAFPEYWQEYKAMCEADAGRVVKA